MKTALLGTAMLALAATAANAADAVSTPVSDWTGVYAGVFGGYAWGSADLSANTNAEEQSIPEIAVPYSFGQDADLDGWLGGLQIGYDYDFGSGFVLGAVADWAFAGLKSDPVCLEDFGRDCEDNEPDHAEGDASLDWLATFRARAGFAVGDALIYATGGLAVAGLEVDVTDLEFLGDDYSNSETRTGWTAGAGIEYRLTENVSVGAEYLYVDLGSVETSYDVGDTPIIEIDAETEFNMSIAKASLNYRF